MSELGFQIFAKVYPVTEEILYAACLVLFFRPFIPEKRRLPKLLLIVAADLLVFLLCVNVLTLFPFQGSLTLSLIRGPYFAGAILPYSGYFLYFLSRFAHLFQPYDLPAYLLEAFSPYFPQIYIFHASYYITAPFVFLVFSS